MPAERSFRAFPRWNIFLAVVPAVVLLLIFVTSVLAAISDQRGFLVRFWPMLVLGAIACLFSLRPFLLLSHTIAVRESAVVFRGLRREFVVRKGEAVSLMPARGVQGAFALRTDHGSASFFARFTGFHEVVAALKAQNPKMTIEGC